MEHETSATAWPGAALREMSSAWGELANEVAGAVDRYLGAVAPTDAPRSLTSDGPGYVSIDRGHETARRRGRTRRGTCSGCRSCRDDDCRCRCCVSDADLVVEARLGELRVVPIRISNERTRPRKITLELSDFASSGGREVPIRGTILTRREFELGACEHEDAVVLIQAVDDNDVSSIDRMREKGQLGDVDDCVVGYADLRIQGCDVRPVRLAVALLPRDCGAYQVGCRCGCC